MLEKTRLQNDIFGCNGEAAKLLKNSFPIAETKHLIGTAPIQLVPFVGVDVIHHFENVRLGQIVERGSLRQNPPNQFVIHLNRAL